MLSLIGISDCRITLFGFRVLSRLLPIILFDLSNLGGSISEKAVELDKLAAVDYLHLRGDKFHCVESSLSLPVLLLRSPSMRLARGKSTLDPFPSLNREQN